MKQKYKSNIHTDSYVEYFKSDEFKNIVQKNSNGKIIYSSQREDYGNGITKTISSDGIHYYKDEKLHREDSPAVIKVDGGLEWYLNGKLHRIDGPAKITSNKIQHWYVNGLLHRENGPAVISPTSSLWYFNGLLHREDGPAITIDSGKHESWYEDTQDDVPSPTLKSKWIPQIEEDYYIEGQKYTEMEFYEIQEAKQTNRKMKF